MVMHDGRLSIYFSFYNIKFSRMLHFERNRDKLAKKGVKVKTKHSRSHGSLHFIIDYCKIGLVEIITIYTLYIVFISMV